MKTATRQTRRNQPVLSRESQSTQGERSEAGEYEMTDHNEMSQPPLQYSETKVSAVVIHIVSDTAEIPSWHRHTGERGRRGPWLDETLLIGKHFCRRVARGAIPPCLWWPLPLPILSPPPQIPCPVGISLPPWPPPSLLSLPPSLPSFLPPSHHSF
ncbi:Hypothetical predicted protein [Xyrichtys novacula]|uniref:Uncharacterized protein n=1 Tax=Xyrichtys novacula TaxID=13765 RepID=A0AAV1EQN4_XYRNO|nr:Hypothetical predicted protein [Xyrichtys novacula]